MEILNIGCEGNTTIWVRDLGGDPCMAHTLGGFHHRVVQQITGNIPKIWPDGGWKYPPIAESLREAGIKDLEVYIRRRQNTVA